MGKGSQEVLGGSCAVARNGSLAWEGGGGATFIATSSWSLHGCGLVRSVPNSGGLVSGM